MRNLFRKATQYFDAKHRIAPLSCSQSSIENWFNGNYGQYLLRHEQEGLSYVMPDTGAHRMMYLGVTSRQQLPEQYNHLHCFSLGASSENVGDTNIGDSAAIADFDALPLPSETVDTVLLHHALEFSVSPHEVLKEASRVLKPCGHMILVVMNPYSAFGLTKWPARLFSSQAVWRHHSLRYGRMLDWLRLLNVQPVRAVSGCFSWPSRWRSEENKQGFMDRLGQKYKMPGGAYYIVVAKKYVARPTLSEPRKWKSIRIPAAPAIERNGIQQAVFRDRGFRDREFRGKRAHRENDQASYDQEARMDLTDTQSVDVNVKAKQDNKLTGSILED